MVVIQVVEPGKEAFDMARMRLIRPPLAEGLAAGGTNSKWFCVRKMKNL
jgi:hypothetical protein